MLDVSSALQRAITPRAPRRCEPSSRLTGRAGGRSSVCSYNGKRRCAMDVVFLVGRVLFALIFVASGFMAHLAQAREMAEYARSQGAPGARADGAAQRR